MTYRFCSRLTPTGSVTALVAAIAALTAANAAAAAPKTDPDADAVRPGTVIFEIDANASASDLKALNALLNSQGLVSRRELLDGTVTVATFEHPGRETAIANILKHSDIVLYAEPDYALPPSLQPNDPSFSNQWHHDNVNSRGAWDISTGSSDVLVGVCDTGFDVNHPDLAGNLRTDLAFNAQDGSDYIFDANGHGTGTAGTLGAVGNNATGVAGMNWNVDIIPVRIAISDSNSSAYISTMATCIEYAADQGARVVNLSYGGIQYSTIDAAARYLRQRNGLLFMSAGNSGQEHSYPDFTSFVGVGATDQNDNRASFSSWGSYVDVTAPGVSIRTTYPNNRYINYSGTSFSSPLTAGIAALMVAANPSISVEDIENGLFSTAGDIGAAGDDDVFGHGLVNAQAAVSYAMNLGSVTPPTARITASSTSVPFGQAIFLNASDSSDPDGVITAYRWDLGDGTVFTTESVTHTYAQSGSYPVSLTVTDDDNLTDSDTITVQITNTPPAAVITSMNSSYNAGDSVRFDASSSDDPDGTIVEYAWNFGDGNTATGLTVDHVYSTGGEYVAQLTVTDNGGAMGMASQAITIVDPISNNPPEASFTSSCTGLSCSFDAGGSSDPDGDALSYSWDFGDQATATGETANHSYSGSGSYTVTLLATDSNGAEASATRVVDVSSASSGITLSVTGTKSRGSIEVDVIWSGASSSQVDIYRQKNKDIQIFTTENDGMYVDSFGGGGSFIYKVCESGGNICSPEQVISF